jgi:hypothetical protein
VVFGYTLGEPYPALHLGHPEDVLEPIAPITADMPPRPPNYYAASNVWCEAVADLYAHRHHMSCLCLRVGWAVPDDLPPDRPHANAIWCSHRDIVGMVQGLVLAPPELTYGIFFGVSANRHRWVDIEDARGWLGYAPQDAAEERLARRR